MKSRRLSIPLTHFAVYTRYLVAATLLWVGFATSLSAQTQQWPVILGGTDKDSATAMIATPDGGYVIAGSTASSNGAITDYKGGKHDAWIVKLDQAGNVIWKKTFGGSRDDQATALTASPDGGFVVTGISNSQDGDLGDLDRNWPAGYDYIWVCKFSASGDIIWKQAKGMAKGLYAYAITAAPGGGYTLAGYFFFSLTKSSGNFFYVLNLSETGAIQWDTYFGGRNGDDRLYAITTTADGGYVLAGKSSSPLMDFSALSDPFDFLTNHNSYTTYDAFVIRLDHTGHRLWFRFLGGSQLDYASAIITTPDGGFLMAGYTASTDGNVGGNHGGGDAWLVKLTNSGFISWQKTVGDSGPDNAFAVQPTADGGYVVAGTSTSNKAAEQVFADIWLFKVNSMGGVVWQRFLDRYGRNEGRAIAASADGSYTVAGYTYLISGGLNGPRDNGDFVIAKFYPPQPLTVTAPTYDCQTGAITFHTSGGTGSPITYLAPGITRSSLSSTTGVVERELRNDPKPIPITAMQDGVTVTYTFDFGALCSGRAPLTLLAPEYQCATGAIHFNTTGGDGSPIEFASPGITGWTTRADQYVDVESRTVDDVQPFTLMARQNGVMAYYVWDLKMACGRARVAADERLSSLQVTVLGNPVYTPLVDVEISGVSGQAVALTITDLQGRQVYRLTIAQSASTERISLPLPDRQAILLLTVRTADQQKQIKLIKP
jgi:hypothetical protein